MTRLIDADLYKEDMTNEFPEYYEEVLDAQPTIDAVQVIRCKDCKWYEFDVPHRCGYTGLNGYIAEDNFCSKAEPKEKKDDR